jgi:hypothetical protein
VPLILALWSASFVALVAVAYLLEFVFRVLGSDFGVKRFTSELLDDIFVSFLPALIIWGQVLLLGHPTGHSLPVVALSLAFPYYATHIAEKPEAAALATLALLHTCAMLWLTHAITAA